MGLKGQRMVMSVIMALLGLRGLQGGTRSDVELSIEENNTCTNYNKSNKSLLCTGLEMCLYSGCSYNYPCLQV